MTTEQFAAAFANGVAHRMALEQAAGFIAETERQEAERAKRRGPGRAGVTRAAGTSGSAPHTHTGERDNGSR